MNPAAGRPGIPARTSGESGRYAATRPAAIFSPTVEASPSIFGASLISEQSLDDVILSYLSEDLDGPAED